MLEHHTYSAFTHFGGKFALLLHGSIFSDVGASTNPGALQNIFYLHCLEPEKWPIFDQHTFRAMQYIKTGQIVEIGTTNKQKYAAYKDEYIPFLRTFGGNNARKIDRALFAFGQFLKLAARYA
ncbi:hypothetical protein CHR62_08730 [Pusillimonas sp. NJUB218]|nr:hypothetical protein CHR62_08730 [Pusillimonas sp. NJUB218]